MKKSKLLFEGASWDEDTIDRIWQAGRKLAVDKYGLTFNEPQFEIVSAEQMLDNYSTVGMPNMYHHWSFGKRFLEDEANYKKGYTGLAYEMVINTDPAICYLMEDNTSLMQCLVILHAAIGHAAFFKNNIYFKENTNPKTILDQLAYGKQFIQECEQQYGDTLVSDFISVVERLSYWGVDRYKRRELRTSNEIKQAKQSVIDYYNSQCDELEDTIPGKKGRRDLKITQNLNDLVRNIHLPEQNLLFFIENYSKKLKPWHREIIRILRTINQYFYPQRLTKLMNEGFACLEASTEYLSPEGWKRIDEYDGGLVAQYTDTGELEFVEPEKYHVNDNKELLHIQAENFDQCVTPDHRMIYLSQRGNLNSKLAGELDLSLNRTFITAGELYPDDYHDLTDTELRIMVAVIADGHFNPERPDSLYCQMAFTKHRKIDRLEALLQDAGIVYNKSSWSQGRTAICFDAPERAKTYKNYYDCARHQLEIIIDEAVNWDGCKKKSTEQTILFGVNKDNLDFLQYAMSVTGIRTSLISRPAKGKHNEFWVLSSLKSKTTTLSGGSITKLEGLHTVYCFTVPSGMFLTRRNNKVSVTGNCYWHNRLMHDFYELGYINEGHMMEYYISMTNVIYQPSHDSRNYSGINPYALGFDMFTKLEQVCKSPSKEDYTNFPLYAGRDWLEVNKEAAYNFKDKIFIQQFLHPETVKKFEIFVIQSSSDSDEYSVNNIQTYDDFQDVKRALANNYDMWYSLPEIEISYVSIDGELIQVTVYQEDDQVSCGNSLDQLGNYLDYFLGDVDIEIVEKKR